MMTPSISLLSIVLLAFSALWRVGAAPANFTLDRTALEVLARAVPAGPHWAAYSDKYVGTTPPDASLLSGFNVFILSFYLSRAGAQDNVQVWTSLTAAQRASIKAQYAAAGITLLVSAFGSTDTPTSSGVSPVDVANQLGNFVIQYGLDGVDIDYEDFSAWDSGSAEAWLITLTQQLRTLLPQGQYVLTHAPIAAWFSPNLWTSGGYLAIDQAVGGLIDWYHLQFYSQAPTEYVTCDGLLNTANQYPGSALFQIAASGVALQKLVIGKPATSASASDYMDPSVLATCLQQAQSRGWAAGVMVWEYPDAGSSWITTVRSLSWPVSGSPPPPSTTTTSTTTSPTSTPTGGSCAGVPAWSSTVAYTGGQQVTYNGHLWTAKWWTEDSIPGGTVGDWTDSGPCT